MRNFKHNKNMESLFDKEIKIIDNEYFWNECKLEAMKNQFAGMTDIPFTYEEFEETRTKLISEVMSLMTEADKKFLISFESGQPEWDGYEFEYFKDYPSVQWKLLNLEKLAKQNPQKLQEEAEELGIVLNF